eukprot:3121606-Amphidinium_carterae.1
MMMRLWCVLSVFVVCKAGWRSGYSNQSCPRYGTRNARILFEKTIADKSKTIIVSADSRKHYPPN